MQKKSLFIKVLNVSLQTYSLKVSQFDNKHLIDIKHLFLYLLIWRVLNSKHLHTLM